MRIDMSALGGGNVLAGALNGKAALGRIMAATAREPAEPELVLLDFTNVEVATASFLRESVLAFRDLVRNRGSTLYPMVSNANDAVCDELIELMRSRNDVLVACELDKRGRANKSRLIGELDPKQRITFDLVNKLGETGASELMRDFGDQEGLTHTTAWNNRLASLATRGLLIETRQGRAKRYRPLMEGLGNGK